MGHWLVTAFTNYGMAVIVVAIYAEGCGVPLPGETVLLAGGFFARPGSLSPRWGPAAAFLAAVAGDNTRYWIGPPGGPGLVGGPRRWGCPDPGRLAASAG